MITGTMLAQAVISAAHNISNHRRAVDELNVFPVPDGDTGTNMSMTINAVIPELENLLAPTATQVADITASAMLRSARGNSGVILSLLFRGFSKGLKEKEIANAQDIVNALNFGVEGAYKAVMKPTEGTILTVARLAAKKGEEIRFTTNDVPTVFDAVVREAKVALENTPNILPVLKKAGVVDAGGQGLVYIFEGMLQVIKGGEPIEASDSEVTLETFNTVIADFDEEINFTYCTEFIVDKSEKDVSPSGLRAYLETIGDCVVVVDDEEIIKVHVHTEDPGNALQEGLKYGPLMNMKVENMRLQHQKRMDDAAEKQPEFTPAAPEKTFGFIAVAAGHGVQSLFKDLGVDSIVSGGQTMNPSTEDILKAIEATPAENVFVLPNNKNIIMAAEQTVALADRCVCVLPTKTIPQGLSAMLAFDPDASMPDNRVAMTAAFEHVESGQITFAARDSEFSGHAIKKGEILALDNGKLSFIEKDVNKTLIKLLKTLTKRADGSFITLIYGSDVTDAQAEEAYETVQAKFGSNYEINLVNGGQPVYYYIISVE